MQKFFSFLLFGGLTYIINIGFTYFQVDILSISQHIAYIVSLFISSGLNFYFAFKRIFKVSYSHSMFKKYISALLGFTIMNYISVQMLSCFWGENYLYLIIFSITTIIFFLKFFVYDRYIFTSST